MCRMRESGLKITTTTWTDMQTVLLALPYVAGFFVARLSALPYRHALVYAHRIDSVLSRKQAVKIEICKSSLYLKKNIKEMKINKNEKTKVATVLKIRS